MSYVALATARFDEALAFYRDLLRSRELRSWERAGARGCLLDLGGGLRLELLDAAAERQALTLPPVGDRFQLVIEVESLDAARAGLPPTIGAPVETSWGARFVRIDDPDGVPVYFLERS